MKYCEIAEIGRASMISRDRKLLPPPQFYGFKGSKRLLEPLRNFFALRFDIQISILIMRTVLNINRKDIARHSTAGVSGQPSQFMSEIRKQALRLGNVF